MDQVKIGKAIAALRRKSGLTQEALGERLGVTNKTVSRWGNGNYMPDVEMLQLLSAELQVSVDELLSGAMLPGDKSGQRAEEHAAAAPEADAFSLKERKAYFQKKWRREHLSLFVVLLLIYAASILLPFAFDRPHLTAFSPLVALVEYGYQNDRMMCFVERHLYG